MVSPWERTVTTATSKDPLEVALRPSESSGPNEDELLPVPEPGEIWMCRPAPTYGKLTETSVERVTNCAQSVNGLVHCQQITSRILIQAQPTETSASTLPMAEKCSV